MEPEADGRRRFRLLGVGASDLVPAEDCDPLDLGDPDGPRRKKAEAAVDALRRRYGDRVIGKGRALG